MSESLLKNFLMVFLFFFMAQSIYAAERMTVFVSIAPQKYVVQKITKDLVDIKVIVPPGENPDTYHPTPAQMNDILKAKLYFSIGDPFEEKWLKNITDHNSQMEIIHTDNNIEKAAETVKYYSGGFEQIDQNDGRTDPHIWLSPALIGAQIRIILNALYVADPVNQIAYNTNGSQFLVETITIYKKILQNLSGLKGQKFIASHPAWGYFARTYQLEQIPVEIIGNKVPEQLVEYAKKNKIKLVVQSPFSNKAMLEQLSRDIGGVIITADPLAENWSENLLQFSNKIKNALQ